MLALEMGLGKTLCVIAAHALEQHTLDDPVMHTALSDAELKKSETVRCSTCKLHRLPVCVVPPV
jgi:hypothetical protein